MYDIREVVSFNSGQRSLKNLPWSKTQNALHLFFTFLGIFEEFKSFIDSSETAPERFR